MIECFFWLITKHFIIDFLLQPPYMWQNKGKWLHPGGLLHAGLHGIATFYVLMWFMPDHLAVLSALCVYESVIHYLIDFTKVNVTKMMKWECHLHPQFWVLMGADQFAHYVTYCWMLLLLKEYIS